MVDFACLLSYIEKGLGLEAAQQACFYKVTPKGQSKWEVCQRRGEATLQISWTSKTNAWTLTSLFKWSKPYFGSIGVWEYICMRYFPKMYLYVFILYKVVREHLFRCFTAMYCNTFGIQYFFKYLFRNLFIFFQTNMVNVVVTKIYFCVAATGSTWF